MRRNELLDLNVEDIDFTQNQIIVKKTKNKDVKIMPMDSNIIELLLEKIMLILQQFRSLQGAGI